MHLYINLIYNNPCISNSECEVSKMIHSSSVCVKQRNKNSWVHGECMSTGSFIFMCEMKCEQTSNIMLSDIHFFLSFFRVNSRNSDSKSIDIL